VPLPSSGQSQTFLVACTRETAFPQPGHEAGKGNEVLQESLNVLDLPNSAHVDDGRDPIKVRFDVVLGDDVPRKLAPGDSKGAFLRVQPNVEPSKAVTLSRICNDVIDIDLKVAPSLLCETNMHTTLVCRPRVL
jgi:hypothetical protein